MACERCYESWAIYFETEPLADNSVNHTLLLRCPDCGSLYEAYPEGRKPPRLLTPQTLQGAFPGTVIPEES